MSEKKIYIMRFWPIVLQSVIYVFSLILFKIFARIKFEGVENIKGIKGPIIFAANHCSEWDGILLRVGLPFFFRNSPMYYVAMEKSKYDDSGWRQILYGGLLFKMLGAYPIYSGKHNYEYSLQNHIQILKQGRVLCMFPEGHRTKDGSLDVFRGGVSFLAHKTGATIIPVAISGYYRINWKKFLVFGYKVKFTYDKAINPLDLLPMQNPTVEEIKGASVKIRETISEMLIK